LTTITRNQNSSDNWKIKLGGTNLIDKSEIDRDEEEKNLVLNAS